MPSPRNVLLLGLASVAVAGGGLTAAATTGTTAPSAATSTITAPAAPAPAPSSTAASAAPKPVNLWVRVPAANVWYRTDWVRRIDRPSLGATPHLAKWVHNQSIGARLTLGNNLMTQALRGEQVVLVGTRGPWAQVRLPQQRGNYYRTGIIGWIWRSQLSSAVVAATKPAQLPRRGSSIIRAAAAYWHTTYIFGGMTRAGIDCSGLTYDAAQQVGITLPRDAADQSRVGAPVTRKALRPGDLVFFGSGARANIHHVAIYIGGGRVLHAPHTGSSVRIDRLRHFPDYWGARRLVPTG
ncbi:MAG TPA: C40 family peptidase [Gaiellales bacterium]|nr:C40 family peptidase [Gaiellales bacterium]